MARLIAEKKFNQINPGNRTEVCMFCAIKENKKLIEARRDWKGKLEGKPVFRIDSEKSICLPCMKEMIEAYEETIPKETLIFEETETTVEEENHEG